MYLFRATNCTYYTRICLPKYLRERGFPFDLKISLLSKNRSEAVTRNAIVTLTIKQMLSAISNDCSPASFTHDVNLKINDVRLSFCSQAPNKIPLRESCLIDQRQKQHQNSQPQGILLYDALDGFIESKSKESIRSLTVRQLKQRTSHFIKATASRYVTDINSAKALQYRDFLLKEGRSVKSNKEYLAAVSQFFKWCRIMLYIDTNPFLDIQLKQKRICGNDSLRKRWEIADLTTLIGSVLYEETTDDFKFATLLMLYQGLRPSEACQLTLKDIITVDGHLCLNITEKGSGQRLKTVASTRVVPVHPKLVNCLAVFVEKKKRSKAKQLFDYRPTDQNQDWSRQYCQRLGRLQTTLGMPCGHRPTAYSFRHTFIDAMKQQEIDESIVAQMVGHEVSSITFGRYGKKYPISLLMKKIKKIDYRLSGSIQ